MFFLQQDINFTTFLRLLFLYTVPNVTLATEHSTACSRDQYTAVTYHYAHGYSCHLLVFGVFLRTYSRHRISNSDPFREQGTNTPLVIGRETGHLDDLLAKYSIQTQQSPQPRTYAKHLLT